MTKSTTSVKCCPRCRGDGCAGPFFSKEYMDDCYFCEGAGWIRVCDGCNEREEDCCCCEENDDE